MGDVVDIRDARQRRLDRQPRRWCSTCGIAPPDGAETCPICDSRSWMPYPPTLRQPYFYYSLGYRLRPAPPPPNPTDAA